MPCAGPPKPARRNRRGFTLLEVLLTLAVIVMIAGLSWPVFTQSFANERLRKAADIVRTSWAKARVQAMTTGQTHVFRFDYGTNQFVVTAWDTGEAETEAATAVERAGKLPDEIVFHAAEKLAEARALETELSGGQTAPQIFFYPDGTTSTAQVLLANDRERFVKVTLRGLTGTPRIGEVVSAEELEQ